MHDGGVLNLEAGVSESIVAELRRRGHRIEPTSMATFGGYQAISRDANGVYCGATERRKDGCALGY